jgi:iron(III) transport system substrate-binding protein
MSTAWHRTHRARALASVLLLAAALGCRIETAAPGGAPAGIAASEAPHGDVWIYTSMYRQVIDELEPVLQRAVPGVTFHWYQAGSEKVANRLEAELAAGGTPADLLVTSDPFLYERYKREGRWLRYASPNVLRVPRSLIDLDGTYAACRLSTMVLVHRSDLAGPPPESFRELAEPRWKGEVALGDPLTSGTSFTWTVFMGRKYGEDFFRALRANGARVAGGNAAVLQKVEGGEAQVGVLLLENALAAKARGSAIEIRYPSDGAVVIPGYAAIFQSTRNPAAAKAVYDALLSPEVQEVIVRKGDMHAVDPRLPGPRGEPGLDALLGRSQPWDEALLARGLEDGAAIKEAFSRAFAR